MITTMMYAFLGCFIGSLIIEVVKYLIQRKPKYELHIAEYNKPLEFDGFTFCRNREFATINLSFNIDGKRYRIVDEKTARKDFEEEYLLYKVYEFEPKKPVRNEV